MFRHNCRFVEAVLGIVVIVFAFLSDLYYSQWIIISSAILLLLHSATCSACGISIPEDLGRRRKKIVPIKLKEIKMEDYHKWFGTLLPALILVFAIWPNLVSFSRWIVIVSAALLLVHHHACKQCCTGSCGSDEAEKSKKKKK